jgi:hypothetical protein
MSHPGFVAAASGLTPRSFAKATVRSSLLRRHRVRHLQQWYNRLGL